MAKAKDTKQDAAVDDDAPAGGRKKLLVIGLVAVLALGASAYFFLFSGGGAAAKAPAAGSVVLPIDPVAINLAGGSYLKLGIALQFTAEYDSAKHAAGKPDGAKALDLAIGQFSGTALSDVQTHREAMKAALQKAIVEAYHGEVYSIYYTEYVTQ